MLVANVALYSRRARTVYAALVKTVDLQQKLTSALHRRRPAPADWPVDDMEDRPAQGKHRVLAARQPQFDKRRMYDPPPWSPQCHSRAVALVIALWRAFAKRSMSVRLPSWLPINGCRAKMSRALGREKRAKISPVISDIERSGEQLDRATTSVVGLRMLSP